MQSERKSALQYFKSDQSQCSTALHKQRALHVHCLIFQENKTLLNKYATLSGIIRHGIGNAIVWYSWN